MNIFSESLLDKAAALLKRCTDSQQTLTCAESCTGGMIAALLTSIPGSSAAFECGFITYSNASKIALLGVDSAILDTHGAVSEASAQAMAEGALRRAQASLAVSVTGIAGPGGGSELKPVGLVYIGIAAQGKTPSATRHLWQGDRHAIRLQATTMAIKKLSEALS